MLAVLQWQALPGGICTTRSVPLLLSVTAVQDIIALSYEVYNCNVQRLADSMEHMHALHHVACNHLLLLCCW